MSSAPFFRTTPSPDPRLSQVPLCGSFSLILPEIENRRLCDLGCNAGYYLQFAHPDSLGVDVSKASLSACQKLGFQTVQHDLNNLPLPLQTESFAVVLLSHVLEHVTMPLHLLRECNRILATGGKLLIGLPIEDGLYSRLRMNYFAGPEGHLFSFSRANLRKLLSVSGFVDERIVCHYPRLGNRLSVWNERLMRWFGESLFTFSAAYWCVARKIGSPLADAQLSDYFPQDAPKNVR